MSAERTHATKFKPDLAPPGWVSRAMPQLSEYANRYTVQPKEGQLTNEHILQRQEARWIETTGILPSESQFTIVIPIRNEELSLPSTLAGLMLSDIPCTVDANIVFVTNGCQDGSEQIIGDFMSIIGKTQNIESSEIVESPEKYSLYPHAKVSSLGNIRFIHLNTPRPSKANAMTIGNQVALRSGHRVCMNVDNNTYPEPDSVREMFKFAHDRFFSGEQDQNKTTLIGSNYIGGFKPGPLSGLLKRGREWYDRTRDRDPLLCIKGWFMAWDTEWLREIGEIPEVAYEDFALAVKTRATGNSIEYAPGANTWGYEANNLLDSYRMAKRFVRGAHQIQGQGDDVSAIVREDLHYMRDFKERVQALKSWISDHPKTFHLSLVKFLLWEAAILQGRREFNRDPGHSSWNQVDSTK